MLGKKSFRMKYYITPEDPKAMLTTQRNSEAGKGLAQVVIPPLL